MQDPRNAFQNKKRNFKGFGKAGPEPVHRGKIGMHQANALAIPFLFPIRRFSKKDNSQKPSEIVQKPEKISKYQGYSQVFELKIETLHNHNIEMMPPAVAAEGF